MFTHLIKSIYGGRRRKGTASKNALLMEEVTTKASKNQLTEVGTLYGTVSKNALLTEAVILSQTPPNIN